MLVAFFLLSVLLAYLATRLAIALSLHRGILDLPNPRSAHSDPVPRMGGIGIVAGFYVSIAGLWMLEYLGFTGYGGPSRSVLIVLSACAGMAAVGLYDDLCHVTPARKFTLQLLLALGVAGLGIRFEDLGIPGGDTLALGTLGLPLTLLWLTGFSNVYNFMDGINGLAGATGVVYCGFFAAFAFHQDERELLAVAVLLMGSCVGFLFLNFPQARTFMGDTGSLFLGMLFSGMVVLLAQRASDSGALVGLVLVCSVYLFDSGFTLLRRIKRHEHIFRAHRTHLYQRLLPTGLSHAKITALYVLLHSLMGALAMAYMGIAGPVRVWILGIVAMVFLSFALTVYRLENSVARRHVVSEGKPLGASKL